MMRKSLLLCLAAFVLGSVVTVARNKPTVKKSEFLVQEEGQDEACENLLRGDRLYRKGEAYYEEAVKFYLKAYDYNSQDKSLNYKIGKCLLYGSNRSEALRYLLHSDASIMPDYYLLLGKAYQYDRNFRLAVEAYNNYLAKASDRDKKANKSTVDQLISECEFSQEAIKDSAAVFITNLGEGINTYYDDYTPYLSNDDSVFFFTSRRPDKAPRTVKTRFGYEEQIYETHNPALDGNGDIWQVSRLTSLRNMAVAGYSKNEERIYIYKGKTENGRLRTALRNEKGGWGRTRRLKRRVNRISTKEGAVSLDGNNNIYFISERRGGQGGNDIWYAEYKGGFNWHKPVNLGSTINTPMDEECVYVNASGDTLYFSSNGRPGFGGFDIYMSVRQGDGAWGEPVNMGYPINTAYDEVCYFPTKNPDLAYFATSREGSLGGLDIFSITIDRRMPFVFAFKGQDKDDGSDIAIDYVIYDKATGAQLTSGSTTADGLMTSWRFEDHGSFAIKYSAEGYHEYTDTIGCPLAKGVTVEQIYALEKLAHPFTLSGVVINAKTGRPVAATIEFRDSKGALLGKTTSSPVTGKYSYDFPDKVDLVVEATAPDYVNASASVPATQTKEVNLTQDFKLAESKVFFVLAGTVKDEETQLPVYATLRITPTGKQQPELVIMTDSLTGKFNANLLTGGPYWVDVEAKGYFFANDAFSFAKGSRFESRNYVLKKMKAGVKITLDNILFKTGSSSLVKSSYEPLDKFADLLRKNPEVRIEVSGHTDNVGKPAANKKLSKARAKTVRDYLIKQGVAEDRIDFEGYGQEQPVESNKTKAGREKNRRVEVKVLD